MVSGSQFSSANRRGLTRTGLVVLAILMFAATTARAQATPTASSTRTLTPTRTATRTRTLTPTATFTPSGSGSGQLQTSSSPTPTSPFTPTVTRTATRTITPTATPTPPQTTDVLTYHNDNARTGQNLNETILTVGNVNPKAFGKLFELPVDGKVDAQPLIKTRVLVPGHGLHNVLYVVTEHDSAYAFDADTGANLWANPMSLLAPSEVPSEPRGGCSQVVPEIGITSTPVIVPTLGPHGTMFVVTMSKDAVPSYFQKIHALDITTGAEQFGGPVTIAATYPGTGAGSVAGVVQFTPTKYKERAGLVEVNGTVYTTWASHCDSVPYTGWIIGYAVNASNTLVQTTVLNITPNGNDGAIWAAGAAPAVDNLGNIYALDGNGTFDTTLTPSGFPINGDFGNSFLKLSTAGGLSVADYFATFNTVDQSAHDQDLGSGGPLVLPDMTDSLGATRHLVVGAGKDHNIYLADRDNMGKFNPVDNSNVYQQLTGVIPGEFAMPAYFNGHLYVGGIYAVLKDFVFAKAMLPTTPTSSTTMRFDYPGTTPSISAFFQRNAIVWAVQNISNHGVLRAFDAYDLRTEYYNSDVAPNGRDSFLDNKFITPTIANGKVYVGTPNSVAVFGLLQPPSSPNRREPRRNGIREHRRRTNK